MPGPRNFPLYPNDTLQYRFDYAVFLLNKDIERLMNDQGLRVLDLRQTLPNLKYLLYILATSNEALPARKAGGVKGLLIARSTAALSRTPSQGSINGELGQEKGRPSKPGAPDSNGAGRRVMKDAHQGRMTRLGEPQIHPAEA